MTTLTAPAPTRSGRSRTLVATRAAAIEFAHRWPSLLVMTLGPLAYFLVSYLTGESGHLLPLALDGEPQPLLVDDLSVKAVYLAGLAIGIAASFAAMTVVRPESTALRRLLVIGYRPWQLLAARLVVLVAVCVVTVAGIAVAFLVLVDVADPGAALVALFGVGATGLAIGSVFGLILPREFEASMGLIAVAGMQMSLGRSGSDVEQWLPYWPGVDLLQRATFLGHGYGPSAALAVGYVTLGFVIALAAWWGRFRLRGRNGRKGPRDRRVGAKN